MSGSVPRARRSHLCPSPPAMWAPPVAVLWAGQGSAAASAHRDRTQPAPLGQLAYWDTARPDARIGLHAVMTRAA